MGAKPNFNLRHVAVGGRPHAERQALSIGAATAPGTSPFCKSSPAKGNVAAPAIWTRAPLRAAKSGNSGSTIFAAASARSETGGAASQDLTSNRIRCAAGAGEPGRERIGGRVPRGGNFGRGERHRGRQPDRDRGRRRARPRFQRARRRGRSDPNARRARAPKRSIAKSARRCASTSSKSVLICAARTSRAKGPPPGTRISGSRAASKAASHKSRSG